MKYTQIEVTRFSLNKRETKSFFRRFKVNYIQNCGIDQDAAPNKTNNFIRLGFMMVFIIAAAVVPSVTAVKFFLV